MILKPYAADPVKTLGRQYIESKSNSRNDFQRDRDRIIHSSAFRRLEYKTQVFVNHEGDMFRTRLTHSIEVSQISRGISRTLGCHEDLAETIALAHDLGHTPFGHAGQDALNNCMKVFGGFEHNLQSLRVVDLLEKRYADFDGLNLTFETREGILKHCSVKNAKNLGTIGERFIKQQQPSLEAQLVNANATVEKSKNTVQAIMGAIAMTDRLMTIEKDNNYSKSRVNSEGVPETAAAEVQKSLEESAKDVVSTMGDDVIPAEISSKEDEQLMRLRKDKT